MARGERAAGGASVIPSICAPGRRRRIGDGGDGGDGGRRGGAGRAGRGGEGVREADRGRSTKPLEIRHSLERVVDVVGDPVRTVLFYVTYARTRTHGCTVRTG
jgi:hypothetical protein